MTIAKDVGEVSPAKELLGKKESGPGPHPPGPLDHLAFAIALDAGASIVDGLAAILRLHQEFVDWNEIRVTRTQELARVLDDLPEAERCALRIKEEYNAFFDKKGALDFDFLAAGKPAETRRLLHQLLPHLGKGPVSLLLFEFCPGASMPLSDAGLKQARKDGVVGKTGDRNQLLRALSESLNPGEITRLIQYWEIEGMGHPYGDNAKKETGLHGRKAKKAKGKVKSSGK